MASQTFFMTGTQQTMFHPNVICISNRIDHRSVSFRRLCQNNSLKIKTAVRANLSTNDRLIDPSRPAMVNYTPDLWKDYFTSLKLDESKYKSNAKQVEVLKGEVEKMLMSHTSDPVEKIDLINTLCRLGVSYHFEDYIDKQLNHIFNTQPDLLDRKDYDLHTVGLVFRVFRQHGYKISCDVLNKFRGSDCKFKESVLKDPKGMLSLYEAAHLSTPGDHILDEAFDITKTHLDAFVRAQPVSTNLSRQIRSALKQPLHRGIPRLEARKYIDFYEGDGGRNETLLNFAKFDFNRVQYIYQQELKDLYEWWDKSNLEERCFYARKRVAECYLWMVILHYEPHQARARMMHGKLLKLLSVVDDTYDAYGTKEEHRLFAAAIKRWDHAALDELDADHLKTLYKSFLDVFSEYENQLTSEGRSYSLYFGKEAVKQIVGAYHREAQWLHTGNMPTTLEEYFSQAFVTGAIKVMATNCFMAMGEIAGIEAFEWLQSKPRILRPASIIVRLRDDLLSHEFEQQRLHIPSAVQVYMKEHGVSEQVAKQVFRKMIQDAWKEVNQECMKPTAIPLELLIRIVNALRIGETLYKDVDAYTHCENTRPFINQLLVYPVPV